MRVIKYQLAKLMKGDGERWCILSDIGDGWFKVVQDFPPEREDEAEAVLNRILLDRNGVGDMAASTTQRTFHHRI